MRQLNGQDASMLYAETRVTPNHVASVEIYNAATAPRGVVTLDDVLTHLSERLPEAPTLRERLVRVPFGLDLPYWVNDPDFDLEFHVRTMTLPAPGGLEQFNALVSRLHAYPIDLTRAPWELHLIQGLDTVPGIPTGGFGVVLKVHHASIDGVAGAELLNVVHDQTVDAPSPSLGVDATTEDCPSDWTLLARAAAQTLTSPRRLVRGVGRAVPVVGRLVGGLRRNELTLPSTRAPATRFGGAVSPHRVFSARTFPLADVKALRRHVPGATVNDVALALVAGTLRRYLHDSNELPSESLTAMVPISIRTGDEDSLSGNHVSGAVVSLCTDIDEPVERLAAIHQRTSEAKEFAAALGARTLSELTEAVPGALLGLGLRAAARFTTRSPMSANTVVTNVPGPRTPMHLCGARLAKISGAGPVLFGMGLVHIVSSYCDDFVISVTSSRNMLPDVEHYADLLTEAFEDLAAAGAP